MRYYCDNEILIELKKKANDIIFVCIGTDKHVWDSLGPMVGSLLENRSDIIVYGTLKEPITAINVDFINEELRNTYPFSIKVVVDVAISNKKDLSKKIYIKRGGIKPGLGVGIDTLNVIGDYSILYYVLDSDLDNKRIRNPFYGALEILDIINEILDN